MGGRGCAAACRGASRQTEHRGRLGQTSEPLRPRRQRIGEGIDPGRQIEERFRRATPRSPPCASIGAGRTAADLMAFTLTLLALLIEATFGYPDRLVRAIGHPVTWIGGLIGWLYRSLNLQATG